MNAGRDLVSVEVCQICLILRHTKKLDHIEMKSQRQYFYSRIKDTKTNTIDAIALPPS